MIHCHKQDDLNQTLYQVIDEVVEPLIEDNTLLVFNRILYTWLLKERANFNKTCLQNLYFSVTPSYEWSYFVKGILFDQLSLLPCRMNENTFTAFKGLKDAAAAMTASHHWPLLMDGRSVRFSNSDQNRVTLDAYWRGHRYIDGGIGVEPPTLECTGVPVLALGRDLLTNEFYTKIWQEPMVGTWLSKQKVIRDFEAGMGTAWLHRSVFDTYFKI